MSAPQHQPVKWPVLEEYLNKDTRYCVTVVADMSEHIYPCFIAAGTPQMRTSFDFSDIDAIFHIYDEPLIHGTRVHAGFGYGNQYLECVNLGDLRNVPIGIHRLANPDQFWALSGVQYPWLRSMSWPGLGRERQQWRLMFNPRQKMMPGTVLEHDGYYLDLQGKPHPTYTILYDDWTIERAQSKVSQRVPPAPPPGVRQYLTESGFTLH